VSRPEIPAEAISLAVSVASRPAPSAIRLGGAALREARRRHKTETGAALALLAGWGLGPDGLPKVKAVAS
jgi:hypothetical protein